MTTMEKKDMYIVIKRDDAKKYLSKEEFYSLVNILDKIRDGRIYDNKRPNNAYYVCNIDEPYADAVRRVIIGGEALKNEQYSCPSACGISCEECFHK